MVGTACRYLKYRPMSMNDRPEPRRTGAEEPIEFRRALDALRRSLGLVIGITVVLAVTTYVVSTLLPERYKATASIVQRTSGSAL